MGSPAFQCVLWRERKEEEWLCRVSPSGAGRDRTSGLRPLVQKVLISWSSAVPGSRAIPSPRLEVKSKSSSTSLVSYQLDKLAHLCFSDENAIFFEGKWWWKISKLVSAGAYICVHGTDLKWSCFADGKTPCHCELLVCVWNGRPSSGGTSQYLCKFHRK